MQDAQCYDSDVRRSTTYSKFKTLGPLIVGERAAFPDTPKVSQGLCSAMCDDNRVLGVDQLGKM
jgi:hypothetical protein